MILVLKTPDYSEFIPGMSFLLQKVQMAKYGETLREALFFSRDKTMRKWLLHGEHRGNMRVFHAGKIIIGAQERILNTQAFQLQSFFQWVPTGQFSGHV